MSNSGNRRNSRLSLAEYNKNILNVDVGTVISISLSASNQLGDLEEVTDLSRSPVISIDDF